MLQKLIYAGAILLLISNAAATQSGLGAPQSNQSNLSLPVTQETPPSQQEIDRRKAVDKAYEATIQKIPDKKSSTDPWGGVRPTSSATTKNKAKQ
jgi:hypothetical protein